MKSLSVFCFLFLNTVIGIAQQEALIDSLKNHLNEANDSLRVKILGDLCWYLKFSEPEASLGYGQQAIASAKRINSIPMLAQAHSDLGTVYYLMSQYHEAGYHYDSSLNYYTVLKDTIGIAKMITRKGGIDENLGRLAGALEMFLRSLELNQKIGYDQAISYDLNNVATIYQKQSQFEKALEYFLRSLEIKERLNDKYEISGTLLNIGAIYHGIGDFPLAIDYLERSIEMCREVEHDEYLAAALEQYGILLNSLKRPEDALPLLNESLALRERAQNQIGICGSHLGLGVSYRDVKNFRSAEIHFKKALSIAKELGAREHIQNTYLAMAEMFATQGNYPAAYNNSLLYAEAKDVFLNEESTKRLAEMRTRYETEEKEQQIEILNKEKQLQKAQLDRNFLIQISSVVLFLLILLIGYLTLNRRRLKQKNLFEQEKSQLKQEQLNAVISSQEEERRRFAMDLHDDFGQLISALKLSLGKNQSQNNKSSEGILEKMYSSLKNIAFNIMPQTLVERGLAEAVSELAEQINALGNLTVSVRAFEISNQMDTENKVATYRIIQELVSNIIKYADADKIDIDLTNQGDRLIIMIEDNGNGFDPTLLTSGKGNGWKNIKSRLDIMSGEIEIDSKFGQQGSTAIILIPNKKVQKVAA